MLIRGSCIFAVLFVTMMFSGCFGDSLKYPSDPLLAHSEMMDYAEVARFSYDVELVKKYLLNHPDRLTLIDEETTLGYWLFVSVLMVEGLPVASTKELEKWGLEHLDELGLVLDPTSSSGDPLADAAKPQRISNKTLDATSQ